MTESDRYVAPLLDCFFQPEVTLWSSTQIPFFLRRNLATTLDLPESRVRIIKPKVGGGFGQKIDLYTKDFCAAFFAMKTLKPVKFVYEREEVFTSTRQRHPMHIQLKTGMKKDGTILAQQFKDIADGGAYNSTAPLMITLACYFIMLPYHLENLLFEGFHVYTNKPVGGAMRGHGIPQVRFAVEAQMDIIAEKMGIDPLDLRLKNAFLAGEPHPAKMLVQTCGFSDTLAKAAEGIGWKEKRGRLPFGRGVGLAGASFPSGVRNMSHISSGAIVKIERDGSITLLTGAADIGQGAETVGVIWGIAPRAQIADLSHMISPQDIAEGSLVLSRSAPYFPPGTVHVAVVDPGVGTVRRPIRRPPGGGVFRRPR